MKTARAGWLLALALLSPALAAGAAPPPLPWDGEELTFRLLFGSLDGNENARLLKDDGQRYAVGLSASSPVAWEDRVEATLEIWLHARGYPGATTTSGETTGPLSYEAISIDYGLRIQGSGMLRPYALATLGAQANRLEGTSTATPAVDAREETLVATAQWGVGMEWLAGRDLFSIDWRRRYAEGDFATFGARGLDLGGDFIGIGLGHRW